MKAFSVVREDAYELLARMSPDERILWFNTKIHAGKLTKARWLNDPKRYLRNSGRNSRAKQLREQHAKNSGSNVGTNKLG